MHTYRADCKIEKGQQELAVGVYYRIMWVNKKTSSLINLQVNPS